MAVHGQFCLCYVVPWSPQVSYSEELGIFPRYWKIVGLALFCLMEKEVNVPLGEPELTNQILGGFIASPFPSWHRSLISLQIPKTRS